MHARPTSSLGQAFGFMSRMYVNNRMYDQYGNAFRIGYGFGSNGYDSRTSERGWLIVDSRYRNKSRANSVLGYGNNLSGKILDLIRNWTKLDKLYLQGTSMEDNQIHAQMRFQFKESTLVGEAWQLFSTTCHHILISGGKAHWTRRKHQFDWRFWGKSQHRFIFWWPFFRDFREQI